MDKNFSSTWSVCSFCETNDSTFFLIGFEGSLLLVALIFAPWIDIFPQQCGSYYCENNSD